mmetsp:Transcript_74182/g.197823  ORF Transcript_74182/g.197823 Transcript_74182/m.197823 type:complete len:588 (+) Transcript_74182:110-1873(+)
MVLKLLFAFVALATAGYTYDHLRYSVVRIQSVAANFNMMMPFQAAQDAVGLGSGWVVEAGEDPLLVTNSHVVKNGHTVMVQLLVLGEQKFAVDVVTICTKFDLALLKFSKPAQFLAALKEQNIELKALKLATKPAAMGAEIVALGFPLGQQTMKISKGVIAGNQEVNGNLCIQSTAAISPGNSGGPLISDDGTEVIAVNFAKSAAKHAEGVNFAIPVWRVAQIVQQYKNAPSTLAKQSPPPRMNARFAPLGATTIEGNPALYELSGGCRKGLFVSSIEKKSAFGTARPAIPLHGFLTHINGVKLDKFGMGRNTAYAADFVDWGDLLFMTAAVDTPVEITMCKNGVESKHKVSLLWKKEYTPGIEMIEEPSFANVSYEIFGDVGVMQMTVNHIQEIVQQTGDASATRWLYPGLSESPRLIVNYVRPGSYAADFLTVGACVTKVNGNAVSTLADFQNFFTPNTTDAGSGKSFLATSETAELQGLSKAVWTMETDLGKLYATMFKDTLNAQVAAAKIMPWVLTPAVKKAVANLQKKGLHLLEQHALPVDDAVASGPEEVASVAAGPVEVSESGVTMDKASLPPALLSVLE